MNIRVLAIALFGAANVAAIFCLAFLLLISDKPCVQTMMSVSEAIVGGTLSIGAFSLAFLGYSLARRQEHTGTVIGRIHSRVAMVMYVLLPPAMLDALVSLAYLITGLSWMFDVSLALVFLIGMGFVIATTYVVAEEFR